ncbi:DMT family transporter [Oceanispirochaeta sp.]|uniref:DMT family transporter n=1 Tax=Oceanispirochaeta sp. TaxID=2035350 RepID=UPI0026215079|nr:DMT family transporter [Oceanispirochaeta sp.]MDA3955603.1 DMT family transporter [Oceanispirochaeta sp.]
MKSLDSRILAILASLLWATAFLGVKVGLESAPPFLFAGIRFLGAGLAVALINRKKGVFIQIRSHWRIVILVGFLQTFMLYGFFFYSLTFMKASTGAIVNGIGPLLVALVAHFTLSANKLKKSQFFCLLMGVAGVFLVTYNGAADGSTGLESLNSSETRGILLMLGGLISGAFASVAVTKSPDSLDPFVLNAGQLIIGSLGLLLAGFIQGDHFYYGIPDLGFWISLLWLMFVTGGGFSIWYYLLKVRKEALSEIAVWRFLIPLGGSVLSWIFMKNDNPTFLSFCGMTLTALSIFLFYRISSSRENPEILKEGEF